MTKICFDRHRRADVEAKRVILNTMVRWWQRSWCRATYALWAWLWLLPPACLAGAGTQAADFLNIPVGGRPAALGAAYTAAAQDAYAAVWNPAGLGFLDAPQAAFMHLSYLVNSSYEFASFVQPFRTGTGLGVSVQYLRPGTIDATDANGNDIGTFSGHYAAYSLAGGQRLADWLAVGVTAKLLDAAISDVSAHAVGFDAGVFMKASEQLHLAAVVANLGSKAEFLGQSDPLPGQMRLAAVYAPVVSLRTMLEGDYAFNRLAGLHAGAEWLPTRFTALRVGYRTDTLNGLSPLAGLTTGVGLRLWGQEFDYAWVPLAQLGSTQYFSMVFRFKGSGEPHTAALAPEAAFGGQVSTAAANVVMQPRSSQ
jgi:hypothetical protein